MDMARSAAISIIIQKKSLKNGTYDHNESGTRTCHRFDCRLLFFADETMLLLQLQLYLVLFTTKYNLLNSFT